MITEFKIEKGIPIPTHKKIKYPFDEMEVGDSFLIECINDPRKKKHIQSYVASVLNRYNKQEQKTMKIKTRREKEGLRVWRVY